MNNIKKLYIANFLTGFIFWYGVEKLFMRSIGISPFGIAINAIVFILVITILDVPTGVLADKWNRKYTLMLGVAALGVSSVLMGMSRSLPFYMFATAIWGLYVVFTSGTFQAITYDSLHELGQEDDYVKHQGRSYGMFLVGISLSSVVGGYVAHHLGYAATYYLSVIPCLLTIFVIASMREPVFHKEIEDTKLWQHVKRSVKLLSGEQLLAYLSMMFMAADILSSSQNEYSGLYYIALGMGAIGNGYANAGKWLAGSLGQFLSHRFAPYTKHFIYVFFIGFIVFTVWRSPFALVFFYLTAFTQAIITTNVESVVQRETPSSIRATTISLLSFMSNVLLIPISIIFGLLARSDVFHAYQFVAAIGVVFLLIWQFRPARLKAHKIYIARTQTETPGDA